MTETSSWNPYIQKWVDSDNTVSKDQTSKDNYDGATNTRTNTKKDKSDKAATTAQVQETAAPTAQQQAQPSNTGTATYVLRGGERVPAQLIDGKTYDMNGNPFSFQNGDTVATKGGYYLWNNGSASLVNSAAQQEALLKQLGATIGYTTATDPAELAANQKYEAFLRNNPELWSQYLNNGVNYNIAQAFGDQAGMSAAHNAEQNIRKQSGFEGGVDGTQVNITNPNLVPDELKEDFAPYIDRYYQQLIEQGESPDQAYADAITYAQLSGYPVYNTPNIENAPEGEISLGKLSKYPGYIKAQTDEAPVTDLGLGELPDYPGYTRPDINMPDAHIEDTSSIDPLQYEPSYLQDYLNRFNQEYDPNRLEGQYDDLRQQLIDANNAAVDYGRLQLQAQLENGLPEYEKLREQNALMQARAANNAALRNEMAGDLGGIGQKDYSLEQNAYDQRMQDIYLEQVSFTNEINQQIAQLEAQGRLNEANILAEWGQAKIDAMQQQYENYWNRLYENASAAESMNYQIAADDWNRRYQLDADNYNKAVDEYNRLRQAGLDEYGMSVDEYNRAIAQYENQLQLMELQLQIDESNRDQAYKAWQDSTNIAMQQAQDENAYNRYLRNDELQRQQLQAQIDESNRDYNYNLWKANTDLALQLANDEYNRKLTQLDFEGEAQQIAYNQALQKLQLGLFSEADAKALGVDSQQAKSFSDRINLLSQIDLQQAQAQLAAYLNSGNSTGSSGRRSSGSSARDSSESDANEPTLKDATTSNDLFQALKGAGATTYADARLALRNAGYTQSDAEDYAELYTDWLKSSSGKGSNSGGYTSGTGQTAANEGWKWTPSTAYMNSDLDFNHVFFYDVLRNGLPSTYKLANTPTSTANKGGVTR